MRIYMIFNKFFTMYKYFFPNTLLAQRDFVRYLPRFEMKYKFSVFYKLNSKAG